MIFSNSISYYSFNFMCFPIYNNTKFFYLLIFLSTKKFFYHYNKLNFQRFHDLYIYKIFFISLGNIIFSSFFIISLEVLPLSNDLSLILFSLNNFELIFLSFMQTKQIRTTINNIFRYQSSFCLSPIFKVGFLKCGVSIIPLEEFPIKA